MHVVDAETDHSAPPAKAEPLKVNQVDYKAIEGKMKCRLEKGVLALGESMEDADLTAVVLIGKGLV